MQKQLKQLRNFLLGVTSTASASDTPEEAPIYSKNIDSLDEEGKLKGAKRDKNEALEEELQTFLVHFFNDYPSSTDNAIEITTSIRGTDSTANLIDHTAFDNPYAKKNFMRTLANALLASHGVEGTKGAYFTDISPVALKIDNDQIIAPDIETTNLGLPVGLSSGETSSDFATSQSANDQSLDDFLDQGDIFKVNNEWMFVTQKTQDGEQGGHQYTVQRGYEGPDGTPTTADSHSAGDTISAPTNWFALRFIINPDAYFSEEDIVGSSLTDLLNTIGTTIETTPSMDLNGRNFTLISSREDNATTAQTDVVYYEQLAGVNPPEYKLKILENFYRDNNGVRKISIPTNPDINTTNEGFPERITLSKGPNAVYIGSGSTASSKAQWLGKIQHKQFGTTYTGYHMEDSRLKSIDDGQAVFTLDYLENPHLGNASSVRNAAPTHLIGKTPASRRLYAMSLETDAGVYGKQFKTTNSLSFIPSAVASSKMIHTKMRTAGLSDYNPMEDTWLTSPSADACDGHGVMTSYHFIADIQRNDRVYIYAMNLQYDGAQDGNGVPEKLIYNQFGYFRLNHEIEISGELQYYSHLPNGSKIHRPPKAGSFINDMYEKNGYLYIQYGHNSGFTFDEEWLYVLDIKNLIGDPDDSYSGALTDLGQTAEVNCKPITPPTQKAKNFGNDYLNYGSDWWGPEETCDFGGITSQSWIGQDWAYGSYSNYIRWRNIDFLGFVSNEQHALYNREVDKNDNEGFNLIEPTDAKWKKVYARRIDTLSDDEEMNIPGFTIIVDVDETNTPTTTDVSSDRLSDNPKLYASSAFRSFKIGPHYGYESYVVFTENGGLTDGRGGEDADGEISAAVYMDAKQITNRINVDYDYKKSSHGFLGLTKKKRHVFFNEEDPVIDSIEEMRILTTNREAFGVSQRIFPLVDGEKAMYYLVKTTTTEDDDDGGTETSYGNDYNYLDAEEAFKAVNGAIRTSDTGSVFNYDSGYWSHTDQTHSVDGVNFLKPQKSAWRYGIYSSVEFNGYPSTGLTPFNMVNKYHTKLDSGGQSTQADNSYAIMAPNAGEMHGPVSKNYAANDNIFWTTARHGNMPKTDTFISKWNKTFPTTTNSISGGYNSWVAVNTNNPYRQKNLGRAAFHHVQNSNKQHFILSPQVGDYQSGEMKYDTSASSWDTLQTTDTYGSNFQVYTDGSLSVGMQIDFATTTDTSLDENNDTVYASGNFNAGQTYYWKVSLLYDGYQEGPLSAAEFAYKKTDANYLYAEINLKLTNMPKRVSAVVLYRKNSANDFYRLVNEIPLATGWAYNTDFESWESLTIDEGNLGATYEAITGIPESLEHTNVNYNLAVVAQGHLVVGDCWHPEIKQGQQFLFKSEPNCFSNFNWAKNYCVLPSRPTAMAWFAGKLFAFDNNNMYKVNLDNLVLEDTYEGIGCTGPDGYIVTDIGMFFCDYQGMYWHNGGKAENISMDIIGTSFGADMSRMVAKSDSEKWKAHAWQDIKHNMPPKVTFDAKTQSVYFCFQNKHRDGTIFNGAWKYGLTRKRWDLQEVPKTLGTFAGSKNDIYVSGDEKLINLASVSNNRKKWSWTSKKLDLGLAGQDKMMYTVKLIFNNNFEAKTFYDDVMDESETSGKIRLYTNLGFNVTPNESSYTTKTALTTLPSLKHDEVSFKITGTKKCKWLQIVLEDMKLEIDAITLVYKTKSVK